MLLFLTIIKWWSYKHARVDSLFFILWIQFPLDFPITILDVTPRWQLDDYVFKVYHVYSLTFIHLLEIYIYY